VTGAKRIKRKRGRPKGSYKLPDDYFLDLRAVPRPGGRFVRQLCFNIIRHGGMKWIDRITGETIHKIDNPGTLRSRLLEAWMPLTIIYTGTYSCSDFPSHSESPIFERGPIVVTGKWETRPRQTYLMIGKIKLHN